MDDEYNLKDELLAACALLGRQADSTTYIKGDECLDALKDLQQFLHRDDPVGEIDQPARVDARGREIKKKQPWELHRALAEWNILTGHIFPLLTCHAHDDPEVLYESMLVMFLMTQLPPTPKIELDDDKVKIEAKRRIYGSALVPSLEGLVMFKEQLASSQNALAIIMNWLMEPLLHESERTEAETVILDLALNMIRNLLQVDAPLDKLGYRVPLPPKLKARLRSAQDTLLLKFAEENVLELLIQVAQSVEEEENRNWNLLLQEVFCLIFVNEDPSEVIGSAAVMNGEWMKSQRRKELLAAIPKPQSVQQRRAKCAVRNTRFAPTFKISTGNGLMYLGATPTARPSDNNKKSRGRPFRKKDQAEPVQQRSAVGRCDVLVELDKFAQLFIEVGFNALVGTVCFDYQMESAAIEEGTDDVNFTSLSSWFMKYHRIKERGRIAALPKRQTQESKSQTSQQAAAGEVAGKKDDGERAGNKDKNEELTTATLESTAARLITILQQEEEGEKEPEPAAAAEGGGGGETEATEDKDTSADTSADLGTDAADKAAEKETEAAEAASKWAAMGSVVTWNLSGRFPVGSAALVPAADGDMSMEAEQQATAALADKQTEDLQDAGEPKTPEEPPEEPLDPYDFNAGAISAIIDHDNLRWIAERVLKTCKPELGAKPQWEKLPALVALMREMVATIDSLYTSHSKTNKDAASNLLRRLVYEWDFGETLLLLIKEYRPFRNSRQYFTDVVDVTHLILRLVKTFSEENPHLQKLRKRRRTKRSKKKVEGKEGEGEWLGGEGSEMEDIEEDVFEDVAFNFDTYMKRFAKSEVVENYTWLISKYKQNTQKTNHQVLKMMDMIARKCNHLPLLFQGSVFNVFEKILSDTEADGKKEFKETVDYVRWVVREFFTIAMQSPCAFLELIAWTKSHGDAELIMRAYKPEERENKGRKGKKNEDEDLLHQQDRKSNKWTEDEDLALKEFFEQFGHKPNAPQIIATLMDKNALQIRARLNKLGMFSTRGGDWSEDEDDDDEASLYVYARRLRNKAPAALDWVIDCYGLACETRDQTLQAAKGQDLPEEFFEVQDYAIVPVAKEEWEYLINPITMHLLGAMGCLGPRPLEGHAFWRIAADALRDDAKTAATLDELMSAQSAEIEEEVVPRAYDSDEEERPRALEAPESPAREEAGRGDERGESAAQVRSEHSPPTRAKKRRIQLQDSSDEDEEPPAKDLQENAAAPEETRGEENGAVRRKRAALDDSDDGEDAAGGGRGNGGGGSPDRASASVSSKVASGMMPSKRTRLAALDSDSE